MADLIIREAEEKDIDGIASLEEMCFTTPWTRSSLEEDLAAQISTYIVAETEGQIVGYVGIWKVTDEGHINNVAVSPMYRRRRIATGLIEAMLKATEAAGVKSHTLEVRAGNEPARRLYAGLGFQEAGLRKGYYQDNGEDAIIMWRYIQQDIG